MYLFKRDKWRYINSTNRNKIQDTNYWAIDTLINGDNHILIQLNIIILLRKRCWYNDNWLQYQHFQACFRMKNYIQMIQVIS